ncbi:MAG: tetratricopeptide repeat protein [Chthoniobacterales bacterium]
MTKAKAAPPTSRTPWLTYSLIAAGAFGAGLMFDQIALRPTAEVLRVASPSPSSALPGNSVTPDRAVDLGNDAYDQQKWASAIAEYERAISLGRDTPDVRTDLGNSYRFSGNFQKALEQYQIAQRQNPNHEQSLFNQGSLYAQNLGDPIDGMAKWREFIARFPSSPRAAEAHRLLAELEAELGAATKATAPPLP